MQGPARVAPAGGSLPAGAARAARSPGRIFLRVLVFSCAFIVSGDLGALTRLDGTAFSLIWPPTAVAAVWFLTGDRKTWPWDVLGLVATTLIMHVPVFGWIQAPMSLLGYLVEGAVIIALSRRWVPELIRPRLTAPVLLQQVAKLFVIALLGGAAQATMVNLGAHWVDALPIWPDLALRTWRNTATVFVVLIAVMTALDAWFNRSHGSITFRRRLAKRPGEFVTVIALTLGMLWVSFAWLPTTPLSFLFLIPTAWIGVRFGKLPAVALATFTGVVVLVLTLNGIGLYASIDSVPERAVVSQMLLTIALATGICAAITQDQLLVERAASQSLATELGTLIGVMDEGICLINNQGLVSLANPALTQLLGRDLSGSRIEEQLDFEFSDLNHHPLRPSQLPFSRVFDGEPITGEYLIFKRSGSQAKVLSINAVMLPRQGNHPSELRKAVCSVRDVTLEQEQYETLASFAGVVAHDLKSPLSVIEGWSEVLSEEFSESLSVSARVGLPMITRISEATMRMRAFISDLLDYTVSKDQALKPTRLDLTRLIEDVATELIDSRTPSSGSLYGTSREAPLPRIRLRDLSEAWGDRLLVRQVVANLMSNSAKYVAPGVTPELDVASRELPSGMVEISIADNGIGIPPEHRVAIFDTFHRVNPAYAGTGLGLSICAQIVRRHGGTIRAEANPSGVGTVFCFTLPKDESRFASAVAHPAVSPDPQTGPHDGAVEASAVQPAPRSHT